MRDVCGRMTGVAVFAGLLAGGVAGAADVKPNATQKAAMEDIERNAPGVVGLAYPTAQRHLETEYVKGSVYKDGSFELTYRFYYRDSDGKKQSFSEKFEFSAGGKLTDHSTVGSSEPWPPFATLKLLGAVVQEVGKELDKQRK